MPTSASQFRELMDEALAWAERARSEEERQTCLRLARTWLQAALEIEKATGLAAESEKLARHLKEMR
jgi:hypothetical protein